MSKGKIKIKVSYIGVLDIRDVENNSIIDVDEGATVKEVLGLLGVKPMHVKYVITTVNDETKKSSYVLHNNDHLSLFLPIGGG